MPFDLALTAHGDLILGANFDYEGIAGRALLEQCMMIRLKIPRGTWYYDEDGTLGSDLDLATKNVDIQRALQEVPKRIMDALEPMEDIDVTNVEVGRHEDDPNAIAAVISYRVTPAPEITGVESGDFFDNLEEQEQIEPDPEEYTVVVPL